MGITATADVAAFFHENYLAYLLLGGLCIMMYVYRHTHLPADRVFHVIALILLAMCLASSMERWSILSYERLPVRTAASVVHYILQPLVIYMELVVISPPPIKNRMSRLLLAVPLMINACIYLVAPFAGHLVFWYEKDYTFQRGPLGFFVYIVTFFYLALLIRWSILYFQHHGRRMGILLVFMAGIAVLTGAMEALNLIPGYIDSAFALGALLYYMYLITFYESQMQSELSQKEVALSKSELALLRQQIKPHFVFNSLHNIKSLIREDPKKAIVTVEDFSEYLRANLDTLNTEGLISFENELANVEAYLSLALVDGSRDIRVVYDLKEEHFHLPPLTVQPLVENAILHGLNDGGTVTISSAEETDRYVIRVSDDGCGFSPDEIPGDGDHKSVGLQNVRTRLKKLCDGTMEIESGPNGTTVTIGIPK